MAKFGFGFFNFGVCCYFGSIAVLAESEAQFACVSIADVNAISRPEIKLPYSLAGSILMLYWRFKVVAKLLGMRRRNEGFEVR